ncbi:hypothetical protein MWU52_03415 [Jannaschia sp. S6380]|uniref:hypothetical protein n=1 Tax=Jannaschia sp. S6380 TaxID=2926408 RepID=UPI001FF10012|nr:hypothetical protein [Jannaschia sp. S6380]MCK0166592.1 hypothetical protein [Jannaschia sp. S6380]
MSLRLFYALYLRISGLGLIALAFLTLVALELASRQSIAHYVPPFSEFTAFVVGLFLLVPWWLPDGLRFPSTKVHKIWGIVLFAVSLAAAALLARNVAILLFVYSVEGETTVRSVWITGIALGLLGAAVVCRLANGAPRTASPTQATTGTEAPRPGRTGLERVHLVFIRLTGIAALCTTAYGVVNRAGTPADQVMWGGLGLLASLCFLVPRLTPKVVARPHRWFHFFAFNLLGGVLIYPPLMAFLQPAITEILQAANDDVAAGITRSPEEITALVTSALGADGLRAYAAVALPLQLAWFTMIGLLFQTPSAAALSQRGARPAPTTPAGSLPELHRTVAPAHRSNLPAIGAAMKLYILADWFVLRLMGLGLIAAAWLLWQMVQDGRLAEAGTLTYGYDAMNAVYVYAGLGALLAVPFLLPGRIAAPRHVGWGLVKSALLVAAALFLIPPIHVAIETFTPNVYHAALMPTVPPLFKAITGVAVTSILLISFFKQLGTLPKTDYKGDPVVNVSSDQLRAMRAARMGQA